jgi:chromosome segregation ATPase
MKQFEREFRRLRRQMEEDFLTHTERVNAQKQSLQRLEAAHEKLDLSLGKVQAHGTDLQNTVAEIQASMSSMETSVSSLQTSVSSLQTSVSSLQTSVSSLQTSVSSMETSVSLLQKSFVSLHGSVVGLNASLGDVRQDLVQTKQEFSQFAHDSLAREATWTDYRKRNQQVMDVVQAALFMNEVESASRFDRLEKRVSRLESRQDGAA